MVKETGLRSVGSHLVGSNPTARNRRCSSVVEHPLCTSEAAVGRRFGSSLRQTKKYHDYIMSEKTPPTAEDANDAIRKATIHVLGEFADTKLGTIPPGGTLSQHPYAIREMDRNDQFVEFVLGDTTTNKIVTFFRKYATGNTDWRVFVYANDDDAEKKNAVEADLHEFINPGDPRTPGIVKINPVSNVTHDMNGGRRRRRTRARKTRKRKTRRSRR